MTGDLCQVIVLADRRHVNLKKSLLFMAKLSNCCCYYLVGMVADDFITNTMSNIDGGVLKS